MPLKIFVFVLFGYLITDGLTETNNEVRKPLPERPRYGGVMGKHVNYPGLTYEPNVESVEGLVHFKEPIHSTYKQYIDRIDSVLSEYENQFMSESLIDCEMYSRYRKVHWDKTCRFDLINLGPACIRQKSYGFEEGMPCIILSLERILNWFPEPYYTNETAPDKIRGEWSRFAVTVHCEGEDPVSKDNIGDIHYYPEEGFHFRYFPYTGQTDWLNPLVAVQLKNPVIGIAIRVTCSVYATNIKHYDKLNTGKVSFDVMID